MTFKVQGIVYGQKQVEDALKQLSKATGKSVLRRALKESSKPTVEAARRLVPVGDGNLRDSIIANSKLSASQAAKTLRRGAVRLYVGTSWPKGAHGHLQEFGTAHHGSQPFLRPAWDATKQKVLDSIEGEIWRSLAKSAKTLARKAAKGTLSKSARRALANRNR